MKRLGKFEWNFLVETASISTIIGCEYKELIEKLFDYAKFN